jgi:hypothetical protein
VVLYKLNKFELIIQLGAIIVLIVMPFIFLNLILSLSFENEMEYILAYFTFLGLFANLFFLYTSIETLPMYRYTILLEKSSLIYKKAETIIYQFDLSEIEYISQKKHAQVFELNLKNKEKYFLPFGLNDIPLFLNTLSNHYHPSIKYNNQVFKAKKQGFVSTLLILIFFPFFIIPLFLNPYIIVLYIIGFIFTYFSTPMYIRISNHQFEIKKQAKKISLNKEEIKNIELKHTYIIKSGHFYQCKLSTINDTYTLGGFDISDIDLFCLLNYWQKTDIQYEDNPNENDQIKTTRKLFIWSE